jgi:RNA-binding protein
MLKKSMKYQLKAQAHALKPVILMGSKGLTEALIQETDCALLANELIKIKLTGVEREEKQVVLDTICEALHAEFVQLVGNIATIYRAKPEEKKVVVQTNTRARASQPTRSSARSITKRAGVSTHRRGSSRP